MKLFKKTTRKDQLNDENFIQNQNINYNKIENKGKRRPYVKPRITERRNDEEEGQGAGNTAQLYYDPSDKNKKNNLSRFEALKSNINKKAFPFNNAHPNKVYLDNEKEGNKKRYEKPKLTQRVKENEDENENGFSL